MITVEQADQLIASTHKDFGIQEVPLTKSLGRILRQEIYADRDFPPYPRITMDGIAINYHTFDKGIRTFPIEAVAAAGQAQQKLNDKANALEVMTGAVLPEGADTVIRYEDVQIENGVAQITIDDIKAKQSVHQQGSDHKKGEALVKKGIRISPAEIGVAATVGCTHLKVSRLPKIAIISTGDELVELHEMPLPHQIRKSNVYQLESALQQNGIAAERVHLRDNWEEVLNKMEKLLAQNDVLIISGGVSKGKFDYLPKALEELNVQQHFHRVAQRPGKPLWFGSTSSDTVVFALPGNPVSSLVGMYRYVLPWLQRNLQQSQMIEQSACLTNDISFLPSLTYFAPVKIHFSDDGQLFATPSLGNGSGDLANLLKADGFLELPEGKDLYKMKERYRFYRFRV